MPTTNPSQPAALGLRAHSGWAALVIVAGSASSPEVIGRRRIETADPAVRGSKQPFHAAEPLPFPEAAALITKCRESTTLLSCQALRAAIEECKKEGYEPAACGVILGSGRALPSLEKILASHALIHTAEGEFYRQALIDAAELCNLPAVSIKERELFEQSSAELKLTIKQIEGVISDLGRKLGPPWTQDQKYAALAGWLALNSSLTARLGPCTLENGK